MEGNDKLKKQQLTFKSRWRRSINQFSKMEEQSKLVVLDTVNRKISNMRLKMKNRLGQIDEEWNPSPQKKNNKNLYNINSLKDAKDRIASTNHDTNVLTFASENKLEQSIILSCSQQNPQQADFKSLNIPYTCHQIREQISQELTEYNKQKYDKEMKQQCSKYSGSLKSMFFSLVNSEKKQLYQFCYLCDEVIKDNGPKTIKDNGPKTSGEHKCSHPLNSISRVNFALERLKQCIEQRNNKLFNIFFHNALQPSINIEELISNITVLKQSTSLNYDPQQVVLRLRLINLIGKKIGLLIQEKDLQQRLISICKSKK